MLLLLQLKKEKQIMKSCLCHSELTFTSFSEYKQQTLGDINVLMEGYVWFIGKFKLLKL